MIRPGVVAVVLLLLTGCGQETPSRDQIPPLRQRLFDLQQAVYNHDRAAIDSLLSVKIISRDQGSDSLLSFVYGPAGDFPFERFGNYDIVYTTDRARIGCFIMDSTASADRPFTLFLAYEHDMWLFTSFEPGTDSVP
ncbi:MAG: hypothetical protein JSW34_12370 [Candidatus Zixiibacteriota bacterium]|nr:MAG: hypothetical protein JSW34_12370 [candidate division Zixibacteria bacterium]